MAHKHNWLVLSLRRPLRLFGTSRNSSRGSSVRSFLSMVSGRVFASVGWRGLAPSRPLGCVWGEGQLGGDTQAINIGSCTHPNQAWTIHLEASPLRLSHFSILCSSWRRRCPSGYWPALLLVFLLACLLALLLWSSLTSSFLLADSLIVSHFLLLACVLTRWLSLASSCILACLPATSWLCSNES